MRKYLILILTILSLSTIISCKKNDDDFICAAFEKPTHKITTQEEYDAWYSDFTSKYHEKLNNVLHRRLCL